MKNEYHFDVVAQAIRFIQANHTSQPSLREIANEVHMSQYHFQRLFTKWAGVSPKDFLQYISVERAKSSLRQGKSTLSAAQDTGLSGNGRLHDLFVKMEACSPGEYKNEGAGLHITTDIISTPFGPALVAETQYGICRLTFIKESSSGKDQLMADFPLATITSALGTNGELVKTYFSNWQVPRKRIKLHLKGSPFQIQIWKALLKIPSGQLCAYKDIALSIDNASAVRAVGTAIGKNPIAYLIPCHRVIKNNGLMGNYRWGPDRKVAINGYEAAHLS